MNESIECDGYIVTVLISVIKFKTNAVAKFLQYQVYSVSLIFPLYLFRLLLIIKKNLI